MDRRGVWAYLRSGYVRERNLATGSRPYLRASSGRRPWPAIAVGTALAAPRADPSAWAPHTPGSAGQLAGTVRNRWRCGRPGRRRADTRPAGGLTVIDAAAADQEPTAIIGEEETAAAIIDEAAAAVIGVPAYADAESAARALGHAWRYQAWRSRQRGEIPELSGLRTADARALVTGFLAGSPAGGWMPERRQPSCCPATASRWLSRCQRPASRKRSRLRQSSAAASVHRADAGDVTLDRRTPHEVAEGYPTNGRSRLSSSRAIERRCTASGPSAMRRLRAQA